MTRAVLSAGSNLGDPIAHLDTVVTGLAEYLVAASGVYRTAPWGGVEQEPFCNITLIVDGPYDARGWLEVCHRLEADADRVREVRWGPRTLDVDVITVDDADGTVRSNDQFLTLPHPRAAVRAFVLVPWREIDADATLWTDDGERRVADLIDALPAEDVAGVELLGSLEALGGRR